MSESLTHEIQGTDLLLRFADRTYRVRGWQKALNPESLKVNLMASREERFHVDTLDLYHAKARTSFVRQAGIELGVGDDTLKQDLGKVLRKVEALQADQLAELLRKKDQAPPMSAAEEAEALELLKSPDLTRRILQDFTTLGVVGEESNLLTGYLAAVSRLLDRPLALLIQSASAAGKSSLMDAVLNLMPEEHLVRYSAMTGQSLFYMGDRSLSHKILSIAEEEGARQASYALKLLQSEGRVKATTSNSSTRVGQRPSHSWPAADFQVESMRGCRVDWCSSGEAETAGSTKGSCLDLPQIVILCLKIRMAVSGQAHRARGSFASVSILMEQATFGPTGPRKGSTVQFSPPFSGLGGRFIPAQGTGFCDTTPLRTDGDLRKPSSRCCRGVWVG